jgi:Sulfotransferase family
LAGAAVTKVAFLLYSSRSGSTYLASELDRIPGVSCSIESDFVARLLYLEKRLPSIRLDDLLDELYSEVKFRQWELARSELAKALQGVNEITVEAVTLAVLKTYHGSQPHAWYVIKGQGLSAHVRRLRLSFTDPRFIYLVRDPRAVFNSQKQAHFSRSQIRMATDPTISARRWADLVRIMSDVKSADVLELRYEDLVSDPEPTLRALWDFLELPAREVELRSDRMDMPRSYYERIPAEHKHLHGNVAAGKPVQARVDAWRAELNPTDIHLIQRVASIEMKRFGYDKIEVNACLCSRWAILLRAICAHLGAAWSAFRRRAGRAHDLRAMRHAAWSRYHKLLALRNARGL